MSWNYVHERKDWENLAEKVQYTRSEIPTKFPCLVSITERGPWDICYSKDYAAYLTPGEARLIGEGNFPRITGKRGRKTRKIIPSERLEEIEVDDATVKFNESFGKRIRKQRELLGIDREQFGEVFGISKAVIGTIETGRSPCTFERALKFCKVLRISVLEVELLVDVASYKVKLAKEAVSVEKVDDDMEALKAKRKIIKSFTSVE